MGLGESSNLNWSNPLDMVKSSISIALILVAIYCIVEVIPNGKMIFAGVLPPEILLIGSVVLVSSGLLFAYFMKKFPLRVD